MLNPTREQIAVALFNQIQTAGAAFKYYSRRPQLWAQAKAFPALYLGNPSEEYRYEHGTASPALVTLEYDVFIYIKSGLDPNVNPDTELNNCIDALEAAMQPPAYSPFKQTLGGIVNHAWIEGTIHRAPGYLDGEGLAILTIKVLVPS